MSTDTSILLLLADLQADKVALIAERDALRDENQQLREALAASPTKDLERGPETPARRPRPSDPPR